MDVGEPAGFDRVDERINRCPERLLVLVKERPHPGVGAVVIVAVHYRSHVRRFGSYKNLREAVNTFDALDNRYELVESNTGQGVSGPKQFVSGRHLGDDDAREWLAPRQMFECFDIG